MASQMPKRVHILPIARAHERVVKIFEQQMPDRVYILYNKDPLETHGDINEEIRQGVEKLVKERTMCGEHGEIHNVGVNFYRFGEALVESYELIYKEEMKNGNQVFANVSGGTKPMAIALWVACALSESSKPVYFPAENYERKEDGTVASYGVAESFEVATFEMLQMADILPTAKEKHDIMLYLLDNHPIGVTDLLVSIGEISDDPSKEDRSERNKIVQRYHRYARQLEESGITNKQDNVYSLTNTGELIANLIEKKKEIDKEIEEQTSVTDFS